MPVIGLLGLAEAGDERIRAFRKGLREIGFVEGENLTIERFGYDFAGRAPWSAAARRGGPKSAPTVERLPRRPPGG
jgi:hypothetical protein